MKIPDELLDDFIRLYEEKRGVRPEYAEAYDKASRLLLQVAEPQQNSTGKKRNLLIKR